MKILSLLAISSISVLFHYGTAEKKYVSSGVDTAYILLKQKKKAIDEYEFRHRKDLIFLIKLEGKKDLLKVKEGDWPDNTECVYTILKNATGKIMLIEQSPYSQSGDWYVEWKHYFDANGNTFAFSKRESLFDESVKGGMAIEEFIKYYDVNFKTVNQSFRLTDVNDKTIKRNRNEFNFRNDKYSIYKNVNDCLSVYHIKLEHK